MEVEWDDQRKINEFSKLNTRLTDYEQAEGEVRQEKEDLDDVEMELELVDEDEELMYKIGDFYVYLKQSEIMERIDSEKTALADKIDAQAELKSTTRSRMDELKTALYAKFGRENINLERD